MECPRSRGTWILSLFSLMVVTILVVQSHESQTRIDEVVPETTLAQVQVTLSLEDEMRKMEQMDADAQGEVAIDKHTKDVTATSSSDKKSAQNIDLHAMLHAQYKKHAGLEELLDDDEKPNQQPSVSKKTSMAKQASVSKKTKVKKTKPKPRIDLQSVSHAAMAAVVGNDDDDDDDDESSNEGARAGSTVDEASNMLETFTRQRATLASMQVAHSSKAQRNGWKNMVKTKHITADDKAPAGTVDLLSFFQPKKTAKGKQRTKRSGATSKKKKKAEEKDRDDDEQVMQKYLSKYTAELTSTTTKKKPKLKPVKACKPPFCLPQGIETARQKQEMDLASSQSQEKKHEPKKQLSRLERILSTQVSPEAAAKAKEKQMLAKKRARAKEEEARAEKKRRQKRREEALAEREHQRTQMARKRAMAEAMYDLTGDRLVKGHVSKRKMEQTASYHLAMDTMKAALDQAAAAAENADIKDEQQSIERVDDARPRKESMHDMLEMDTEEAERRDRELRRVREHHSKASAKETVVKARVAQKAAKLQAVRHEKTGKVAAKARTKRTREALQQHADEEQDEEQTVMRVTESIRHAYHGPDA